MPAPKPCGCRGRARRRTRSTSRFGSSRPGTAGSRRWNAMRRWRQGGTSRTGSGGGRRERAVVIRYLLESSALWQILRDPALRAAWAEVVTAGAVGSCQPQRVELRRSARTADEYEQMSGMFEALYPDAAVPTDGWRWAESAQHRLLRHGAHRALSAVDLLICATAARKDLAVPTMTGTSQPPPGSLTACGSATCTARHRPPDG
jgi:predicted nucleic acid-binding protein